MAYLAFAFVCLMWGSTFILIERVSHALGPVEIGITRLALAAVTLSAIWWFKRDQVRFARRDVGPILFSALVANAVPYVTQPYVLAQGFGHSFFGVAVAAVPLLTILMSIPMLGLWPSWRQLLGVVGGLVCLWFVVEDGIDRGMSLGLLVLAAVVPVTSAFNNNYVKLKLSGAQALPVTTVMLGSTALMLLPLECCRPAMTALDLNGPAHPVATPTIWLCWLVLGVVSTGLSTVAFFYMVLERGPLFAGMTTYVVPLLAIGWGMFDHERISGQQLAAMAGVLVMVALVQSGTTRAEQQFEMQPEPTANLVPPPLGLQHDSPQPATGGLVAPAVVESQATSA
jgi:drug/metabolite transporter (DMT)-like permease